MNKRLNKIDKLIEGLCPNGVEFKELGKIAVRTKGTPITAMQMKVLNKPNAPIKIFAGGKTVAYFDYDDLPEKDVNTFPSVVVKSRGVIEFEYYNKPFSHKNEMWSYHSEQEDVDIKYLYYFLKTQEIRLREKATSMGAFPQIAIPDTEKIKIPLPPLPIQQEIVSILDKFTELEAELEAELDAELEARKKQYEFYSSFLLSIKGEFRKEPLANIAVYSKDRISSSELTSENYIGVDNLLQNKQGKKLSSYVPTNGNLTKYFVDDILIGNIRPYLKKIWFATNSGGTNGDVLTIRIKKEEEGRILPKFLYHVLASDSFFDFDMKYAKGGKMPRGDKSEVMKYVVPIPKIVEQERVVNILDKFDKLVNDISVGLPAELDARRQQYEYYRNKLLTFKEKPNE